MNRSMLITAASVAMAGILGSATASADNQPTPQDSRSECHPLIGHCIQSATPHWVQDINGKRMRHLTGVDLRIGAEPGLTAEYLTVEARRAAAATPSGAASVLGVQGSQIEVRSTGDGFVLHITAADPKNAEEIVRRARLLG